MAPLPESNTARLFVGYNDGIFDHTLQFRYDDSSTTESDVMDVAHDYLSAIAGALYAVSITTVERSASGSNVRLPVTWSHSPSYGSGAMPGVNAPRYLEFTGKDQTGRRWHLTQFGIDLATPTTYKLLPGDDADVDAGRAALVAGFLAFTITSIAAQKVMVNLDVPVGFNDHFIDLRRG
jgi:hypothetical protein